MQRVERIVHLVIVKQSEPVVYIGRPRRIVERAFVECDRAEEIPVRRAILADVTAPALYLKLLEEKDVTGRVLRSIRRFRFGWGTFKMDWALSGPVPWTAATPVVPW